MADGINPIANLLGRVDANGALFVAGDASTIGFPILAPDGSTAAPSYSFASEGGLGFYRAAAGVIGIANGNVAGLNPVVFNPTQLVLGSAVSLGWASSTGAAVAAADTLLSRGAANRLDLASGDSFNIVSGTLTVGGTVTGTNIIAGAGNTFLWAGRSQMASPSDGVITLFDNALATFARLQFGGSTSAFPALKRVSTVLQAKLADDSGFAEFHANSFTTIASSYFLNGAATAFLKFGTGSPEGVLVGVVGSLFVRSDGGAVTTLYVKESGAGNTGWVAK